MPQLLTNCSAIWRIIFQRVHREIKENRATANVGKLSEVTRAASSGSSQ